MARRLDRVRALFLMELRTLFRDRRTIVLSIVLPLVVMPLMLFASRWMDARRHQALESREAAYTVVGPRAGEARALLARALEAPSADDRESAATPLRIRERMAIPDAAAALADGSLDFYVEALDYAQAEAASKRSPGGTAGAADAGPAANVRGKPNAAARGRNPVSVFDTDDPDRRPPADLLTVSLVFRSDRDTSEAVVERLAARLKEVRREQRHAMLRAAGFPAAPLSIVAVEPADLASGARVAGLALGRMMTLLLLFFLLSGGAVVAQDTLAGEKERGTLETLLTSAISRREIVTAKVMLVFLVALAITIIQVVNLLVYVGFGVIPTTQNLTAAITPGLAAGLLLFLLPLAALVAGVLVLVSGYARSHREAQLYFLPLLLVGAVPAMAAFLPEISLRSIVSLIPVANTSVGVKELLIGRVDWPMLLVAWAVTAAAAAFFITSAARLLSTERLIVPATAPSSARGTGQVRPGQVTMWFAVMWAVVLVVSINTGPDFDIRAQLLVNLVIVFLGGSLLFIRRFRLDPGTALSLHRPHPAAWIAVAAGIPAGLITGIGIFRLSQFVIPVPRQMLESFSQYVVPDEIPFWQLVAMMSILPGVCEEIAFRGVLLDSLRRHFSRPVTILLVGVAFGLFHFSLFRILQTAYLGVMLAAVTILTGSIFPAMMWHAGSNGLALTAARFGFGMAGFEPATYLSAAAILALCFWILWRTRPAQPPTASDLS